MHKYRHEVVVLHFCKKKKKVVEVNNGEIRFEGEVK